MIEVINLENIVPCQVFVNKYLSKINYTFRSSFCLLPIASCLSSLGNLFCMTTYLLVSQTEPYIEQYFRLAQSDRWQLQTYDQLSQIIPLESLNVELPLLEIYRRVSFAAAS